jgi:hypothetical protein
MTTNEPQKHGHVGTAQRKILWFLSNYGGWVSIATYDNTIDSARRLAKRGMIELNQYNQARMTEQQVEQFSILGKP